jgi:hypothetical protein
VVIETNQKLTYEFPEMNSEERLTELILYISAKCIDDPDINATRLNKILFWSDFRSFALYGKPITGSAYKALEYGPAPAGLDVIRKQMVKRKELSRRRAPKFSYKRIRLIPLRDANLDLFTARDIALVDEVIEEMWGMLAKDASLQSHGIAWEIARANWTETGNDLIPYEAIFLSDEPITEDETVRVRELNARFHWE